MTDLLKIDEIGALISRADMQSRTQWLATPLACSDINNHTLLKARPFADQMRFIFVDFNLWLIAIPMFNKNYKQLIII